LTIWELEMTAVAVAGIDLYRRYLSPLKGFTCAHNHVHSAKSCSTYGRDVYASHGLIEATRLMRARFAECKAAGAVVLASRPGVRGVAPEAGGTPTAQADEEEAKKKSGWNPLDCVPYPGDCNVVRGAGSGAADMCGAVDICSCSL
jgi:putative component of membrane protein insertase Oxa1/YidC/SpoIIIJ protein YidD